MGRYRPIGVGAVSLAVSVEQVAIECKPAPWIANIFAGSEPSRRSSALNLSRKTRRMRARPVSNASRYTSMATPALVASATRAGNSAVGHQHRDAGAKRNDLDLHIVGAQFSLRFTSIVERQIPFHGVGIAHLEDDAPCSDSGRGCGGGCSGGAEVHRPLPGQAIGSRPHGVMVRYCPFCLQKIVTSTVRRAARGTCSY